MLIRSQDREILFDMAGSAVMIRMDNSIAGFGNNQRAEDEPIPLGHYETRERAAEVLDEICRTYEELNYVDRDTARGIVMNGIYQMPEE